MFGLGSLIIASAFPPKAKLPSERVDFDILAKDERREGMIKVVHKKCGGVVVFDENPFDPPMSTYKCTQSEPYCPGSWTAGVLAGLGPSFFGLEFTTGFVVEEPYTAPFKLVERSG